MAGTIDMQHMRYLNLFEKMTRVSTIRCFKYNETIFFCVPKSFVSKAIGKNASNIRQLSSILNKKIKVIPYSLENQDIRSFIQSIVDPIFFKDVQVEDNEIILSATTQSKASLIGRNKRRLLEMHQIIKDFFGKEFRIV